MNKVIFILPILLIIATNKLDAQRGNYAFYNFKFDIKNAEHIKLMNEPTLEQVESYSKLLDESMNDSRILSAIENSKLQVESFYNSIKDKRNLNQQDFKDFSEFTRKEIKVLTKLSADIFDPVNGFAGGPIGTCISTHPVMRYWSEIIQLQYNLISNINDANGAIIKPRNEPDGKLSANVTSMYDNSVFLSTVNDVMNGDPDMPQDLTGDLVRFEMVPSTVPSYFTNPSNPIDNVVDLRIQLEDYGIWGGIPADVFAFEGISTVFGTGTGVAEFDLVLYCTTDIPIVNMWMGSSSFLSNLLVGHELTHSIAAVNHTNTQGDIDNNEIMRASINVNSNFWNVDFTINPFWAKVDLAPDCINAITPLPITLIDFSIKKKSTTSQLSWSTASEVNNKLFTIERSGDGVHFSEIGTLPESGNSSTEQHYTYIDEEPLSGINYYRVRQTGFDGQYSYTPIESILFSEETYGAVVITPNPVRRMNSITLTGQHDKSAVKIYNVHGVELPFKNESNHIFIDYEPGIYYLISQSSGKAIRLVVTE